MSTDAKRKANQKYEEEKTESIRFRVPKGKKILIQHCADLNNESVNSMLNRLVDEELSKQSKGSKK